MKDPAPQTLRAGRVLCDAAGAILGPTEIAIGADGRISSIQPLAVEALTREEAGTLVMPALADAHDHGRGLRTLAYGAADQSLETWLPELRRQPKVDPWLNAVVALGRLARSGVAVVNHCHNTQDGRALLAEAEAVSRAARDVGVRVAFGWPFFDRNPLVYGDLAALAALSPEAKRSAILVADQNMRDCETNFTLFEQAKAFEHATFTLQYHPVAPQWARPETLAAIATASAADGRRIHTHLLETELQRQWADTHHPQGLVAWLDELGLLSERLTVAHCVWLDDRDIALLAKRGVTVSINASSNLRLRSGTPALASLLGAGVPVAFGLDGMALDDDEDMLREIRLAWHLHARCGTLPGPGLDMQSILRGALKTGRKSAIGEDGGGRILLGAPADLLLLDFAAIASDSVVPDPDPLPLLMGRARSEHVRGLIVNGRNVVDSGACLGIDLAALEARLIGEARAAYAPTDLAEITQAQAVLQRYYGCGCHQRTDPVG
ncbi:cytosine deaminase [Novosphingobium sp. Rr 2-17]|uniref:amidohydrolase family protein n=1 Tax=Novosphingobium sp. Rr 2-17 TaxID=555793 RepID=UPI000269A54B|nr:amidohydrolase family protein [Novosphingobium sp. Rr 2-17]EIZ77873.1 cytosine deaminase [Novosphingobium sp. Rr 2-17]